MRITLANEKFADHGIANRPLAAPEKFVGAILGATIVVAGHEGRPAEMCTNEPK